MKKFENLCVTLNVNEIKFNLIFWIQGEEIIRTEDILNIIEKEGDSIAVILFGGLPLVFTKLFQGSFP